LLLINDIKIRRPAFGAGLYCFDTIVFHKAVSFRHDQVISLRARSISLLPSFSKESAQPSYRRSSS
jgi:hypothetical protein